MRFLRIGILLLLIQFSLDSKPYVFYKKGDLLYVLGKSGLNLRSKPTHNSRLLQMISFGSSAVVRETTNKEFEVEGIKGLWVKVIADDREGYLFDGYLSSYPPPVIELPSQSNTTLKEYAKKYLPKSTKVTEFTDEASVVTSTLILPYARIEEAYLLGTYFVEDFEKHKFPNKTEKVKFGETEIEIKVSKNKSGEFTLISVSETYVNSGGKATLIVTDLGNLGVEIKTILAAP